MSGDLIELRHELTGILENVPGFRSVGFRKAAGEPVFVVSVDANEFHGGAPSSFRGYGVEVMHLGCPAIRAVGA